jgi:phosphoserine phosphatase
MRHAKRVDANQDAIVATLRAAGAYVWIISLPVDLLVGYKGHTFLVEIKTDAKKRLTALQADFFENWIGGTLARIDSPDAALRMIGVLSEKP